MGCPKTYDGKMGSDSMVPLLASDDLNPLGAEDKSLGPFDIVLCRAEKSPGWEVEIWVACVRRECCAAKTDDRPLMFDSMLDSVPVLRLEAAPVSTEDAISLYATSKPGTRGIASCSSAPPGVRGVLIAFGVAGKPIGGILTPVLVGNMART